MKTATALLTLFLTGCDGPLLEAKQAQLTTTSFDAAARTCPDICQSASAQLTRDFGVEPGVINCSARDFQAAQTCEECERIFIARFGVRFTSCAP